MLPADPRSAADAGGSRIRGERKKATVKKAAAKESRPEVIPMNFAILILVAILGGVAVTLQGQFMGLMDRLIGTRESVFITYVSGGVLVGLFMLLAGGGNLRAWPAVPWYALTAGVLGLLIVGAIGYTVPRLGLALAFTVIVAAQFMVATLIDHFGWLGAAVRPLGWSQMAGIGLLIAGVWLMSR
jgi:transporter family-2 protein